MSSFMDPHSLNKERLFLELRNSFPQNIKDTRNILEIRDNVLYVWNARDFCVMTLNLGATRGKSGDVPYQFKDDAPCHRGVSSFASHLLRGTIQLTNSRSRID
ncbi:PREDICTED: nuclear pore complex protein Nup88-like [Eufriesea mexicana]|uniref:nuclear pore complex protein Nup88-like n=1 Tax=Eufriesea mexicana TaxID=516756 RepID=UPI00083C84B0|nr:PREDICTED: nuclear pore complex protein Nup88-like [Eufriesea mexicana]